MGNGVVTFNVMPENPEVDMEAVTEKAKKILNEAGAKGDVAAQLVPVAFGLKQLVLKGMYAMDTGIDFDTVAESVQEIEGVGNAEVAGMDLALG